MSDKILYNSLAKLGFPMFEPDGVLDANETLAEVVKSNDTRLWEGFPVLLANAAEKYQFSSEGVLQQFDIEEHKKQFHILILLSASVYSMYHLSFPWFQKLKKQFSDEDKKHVRELKYNLVHHRTVQRGNDQFDLERVVGLFELYFEKKVEKDRKRIEKIKEFSLEYALSQVFSSKQKVLFKKKLEGSPLTKTEQEYYSRTVKKKVVALANSELHTLSQKLLEK